ncbi:pectin lyase fold/virulence factor [Umbelopsis sp. PMI_123]|nr:pectin lyase fold/virulence factor [Umbelopsis sp. PMI_123]
MVLRRSIIFVAIVNMALQAAGVNVVQVNPSGTYKTIAAALATIPNDSSAWEVDIAPGTYVEQLSITRSGPITLRGKTNGTPSSYLDNLVTIAWNQTTASGVSDDATSALIVNTPQFKAYNINFKQLWGTKFAGPQAVAVSINADKVGFYQSYFFGYQDTLYSGVHSTIGRQYFKDCYIVGAVDYIFGTGSSYFDSCTIASIGPGHLTAQKRAQSDDSGDAIKSGYIFNNCRVVADSNTNGVNLKAKVDLGRPWSKYARVVYMNTYMSDIIAPTGWGSWYSTTLGDYSNVQYYEYNNTGPGSWSQNAAARATVNYTMQLTASEASAYSLNSWFGDISWL